MDPITFTGTDYDDALHFWQAPWRNPLDIRPKGLHSYVGDSVYRGFSHTLDFSRIVAWVVSVKAATQSVTLTRYVDTDVTPNEVTQYEVTESMQVPEGVPEEVWKVAGGALHDFSCACPYGCIRRKRRG